MDKRTTYVSADNADASDHNPLIDPSFNLLSGLPIVVSRLIMEKSAERKEELSLRKDSS